MNSDVTDVEVKRKTTAAAVLQMATQVQTIAALYMFVKGAQRQPESGVVVKCQLLDKGGQVLALNSKLLLPALLEEFNKLGQELEDSGIDLSELFSGLNDQFENLYK